MTTGYVGDDTVTVVFEDLVLVATHAPLRHYEARVNGLLIRWAVPTSDPDSAILDNALHEYKRRLMLEHSKQVHGVNDRVDKDGV